MVLVRTQLHLTGEHMNDIPRRARVDQWTPVEKTINEAVQSVERVGAHPWLTEAVTLLQAAQSKVADYIDREMQKVDIERLKKFYSVSTLEDLVTKQADHVKRLQSKLPQQRNEIPGYVPRIG